MNPEIERLQRVMATAIKWRESYRERVENPINQKTGKPLSPYTVKLYRSMIRRCASRIDLCEREIQALVDADKPEGT